MKIEFFVHFPLFRAILKETMEEIPLSGCATALENSLRTPIISVCWNLLGFVIPVGEHHLHEREASSLPVA